LVDWEWLQVWDKLMEEGIIFQVVSAAIWNKQEPPSQEVFMQQDSNLISLIVCIQTTYFLPF